MSIKVILRIRKILNRSFLEYNVSRIDDLLSINIIETVTANTAVANETGLYYIRR